jgi:putative transposase
MDVDRHTHPCQDVLAGTGIHSDKAESCIKMLKVEAVYFERDYETLADVTADLPRCIEDVYNTRRFRSALPT